MATAVKRKLSGSTDGRGIKIAATSTPGTSVHTAVSGTTAGTYHEIWLYAYNDDTQARTLTLEFGGTTSPDDNMIINLAAQSGLVLIVPGLILQNSAVVRAYASVTNKIILYGFVNSITD